MSITLYLSLPTLQKMISDQNLVCSDDQYMGQCLFFGRTDNTVYSKQNLTHFEAQQSFIKHNSY